MHNSCHPNSWFFCSERVAWNYFCENFWSSSSGTCASSWTSSNLFTLSCLGWEWSFSSVLFLELWCLFLLLPLVILKIIFCETKQFSAAVLPQDEYWSLTIMQQPSPWDALSEIRLTMQDRSRRNRFNQTAWQNQAQYSFKFSMTNCAIGVQSNSQEMAPSANASY